MTEETFLIGHIPAALYGEHWFHPPEQLAALPEWESAEA